VKEASVADVGIVRTIKGDVVPLSLPLSLNPIKIVSSFLYTILFYVYVSYVC